MRKSPGDELIDILDYSEASDFLTPASHRNLKVGLRLNPEEVMLLLRVFNHTYGKPRSTFEPKKSDRPELKRLVDLGFVEEIFSRIPHWARTMTASEYRITEKGALRLLDPESLVAHMVMDL
jgi:hypothetical protein